MASEFITNKELPQILASAQAHGTRIISIILKKCGFTRTPSLAKFQAINDPTEPLINFSEARREELWDIVAEEVSKSLTSKKSEVSEVVDNYLYKNAKTSDFETLDAKVLRGFFTKELQDPKVVEHYYVYSYHHIDVLETMQNVHQVIGYHPNANLLIRAVESRLKSSGWEGDGKLQLIWLPPFIDVLPEDTWGTYVWHVKQSNNGTSWIASSIALNFERLDLYF